MARQVRAQVGVEQPRGRAVRARVEIIIRACEQGIPVFCEKPVASTVAETVKVLEAS
ncbi:Gfo/Idh/MocA family oxidoreductase, partial [Nonomuraea sp. NPDC049784]|uniref:Gfo/Idh/MocA family oxidoreductase n=1 Tax=Nonomuraea sp. NPDC049784 TaxID=3154361 RepID=UPI00340D95B6